MITSVTVGKGNTVKVDYRYTKSDWTKKAEDLVLNIVLTGADKPESYISCTQNSDGTITIKGLKKTGNKPIKVTIEVYYKQAGRGYTPVKCEPLIVYVN